MKRSISAIGVLLTIVIPIAAQEPRVVEALDGLDPVLLVQGKEVAGKADLTVQRGRFQYLFSSAETKATFEREPQSYEIQSGGMCARMGKTAGGNPSDFLVHNGRIYVFGSDDCHKKFQAAPEKYLPSPPEPMPTAPDAMQKGRALLERMVQSFGGAERLGRVKTYVETGTQVQTRPQGDRTITTKVMRRFPDATRLERSMDGSNGPMTSSMLLTTDGAWYIGQGHAYPVPGPGRASLEEDLGRHPVALLRARNESTLQVAALGPGSTAGLTLEQVRVRRGGMDVTLGVDRSTGQLHSMTFIDRNNDGEFGTYTIVYSDYRSVDGLTLPFTARAFFNGQPDQAQSQTLTAIEINPPLDAAIFAKPPAGGQ